MKSLSRMGVFVLITNVMVVYPQQMHLISAERDAAQSLPGQTIPTAANFVTPHVDLPGFCVDVDDENSDGESLPASPRHDQDAHLNDSFVHVPSQLSLTRVNTPSESATSALVAPAKELTPAEMHARSQFIGLLKKDILRDAERPLGLQDDVAGEYAKFLEGFADTMATAVQNYDAAMHLLGLWYFLPVGLQSPDVRVARMAADGKIRSECLLVLQTQNISIRWAAAQLGTHDQQVVAHAMQTFSVRPSLMKALQASNTTTKATLGLLTAAVVIVPVAYFTQKAVTRRTI